MDMPSAGLKGERRPRKSYYWWLKRKKMKPDRTKIGREEGQGSAERKGKGIRRRPDKPGGGKVV